MEKEMKIKEEGKMTMEVGKKTMKEELETMKWYCTENQNDPECKPEWIITEGEIPEAPYGPGKGKGKGKKFPKFKKHAKKPPKKHKIKDPTEGLPNKYKKKLPPGKVKKMKKEHIDALRKNCPGNSCKEDKDEHRHSRATLADYDVALLKLAYPDKSLEEIDEYVETKMQRVYELKEIIYEKLGVHDFVADNGLYGHNLLTLEQAEAYIAQLNSSLEYSYAIPDVNNKRRKRAGNLLYFKTSPTRKWPIGTPIPYGFDNCGLSYIGVYTPSNPIYLSFLCNDMAGVACHEVMHALGVEHEHIRPDRDDSITVLWDNIDAQFLDYYVPADGSTYSSYGIPYKCDSIMHYSYKIGARDYGLHTMTCKVDPDINDPLMGQRKGLTQADVDAINKLYCYPEECTDNSNFCGAWATQGLCYCPSSGKPNCYMVQNCPNSCNFCTCTQYED
uniref:Metalloendopeptidase n=1 Tax=Meloidogyne javanica TaxID=6303 RepID=A0A915MRX6_MELJA